MNKITVLLAEDHTFVREGFRKMLELERDFEVVGEAGNGREAMALVRKLRPDVVLMDIAMPRLNGLEATRQMMKGSPSTRVIMLSAHSDDAYLSEATKAGAVGFLVKQSSARSVCEAIREVHKGNRFFSASVKKRLRDLSLTSKSNSLRDAGKRLTFRETEVLQLIAEGKANKQTASELGISIKTVEKHRENLMGKLQIRDTAGLTRYAIAVGIIESSVQLTIV
ncbi:MAG TPA: response regulator transcription factor [Verrucomicrobiae bacterium]|nr:response regulator transcription factor [Verrucomicrobiae bacterium]